MQRLRVWYCIQIVVYMFTISVRQTLQKYVLSRIINTPPLGHLTACLEGDPHPLFSRSRFERVRAWGLPPTMLLCCPHAEPMNKITTQLLEVCSLKINFNRSCYFRDERFLLIDPRSERFLFLPPVTGVLRYCTHRSVTTHCLFFI